MRVILLNSDFNVDRYAKRSIFICNDERATFNVRFFLAREIGFTVHGLQFLIEKFNGNKLVSLVRIISYRTQYCTCKNKSC